MVTKLRTVGAIAICTTLLLLAPRAFADSVRADWDHNVNFSRFHTYSWGPVKVSDPFDTQRIENALNYELHKKGWREVPSDGQVTVSVVDHVRNEKQVETYYDGLGGGWGLGWGWGGWGWGGWGWGGWGWGPGGFGESRSAEHQVPADHLIINLFDTQNKQLIWRGISQSEIKSNPQKEQQAIYQGIRKLFYTFPPKSK